MSENYNRACVEALEIIKYLDPSISNQISIDKIEELNNNKDPDYDFEINKNIPLYDNNFMPETILIIRELLNL